VLATPDIVDGRLSIAFWTAVVVAFTVYRTVHPIDRRRPVRRTIELTAEAALMGIAVASTGYFVSPLAFSTLTAVSVAGFISGFGTAIRLAVATAAAVGIPMLLTSDTLEDDVRTTVQWSTELVLVGLVAGYARRITGDADERRSEALDRLGRLADANHLLYSLHQVAQDLPASLDLEEVLESTMNRLRELLDFDTGAVLLLEESDRSWRVARRYGGRIDSAFAYDRLPPPIGAAAASPAVVPHANLLRAGGPGLSPRAGSGIYVSLRARGSLVGVIALEHEDAYHFSTADAELLEGFAEAAALAVDNARWFARLRTVGADEERTRIARDLHDRIGQSLAYLAFELDRIVRKDAKGTPVTDDLTGIRDDVRNVVREVRDTLYDLRTDVSEDRTVEDVLTEFSRRVEQRSGMRVALRIDEAARLPRVQERELWRIAQEAIMNAERHSGGSRIDVFWYSNGAEAIAEVRDDGIGMPDGRVGRLDSYGMLGMRERAASIGAKLSVESAPRRGVTVRVALHGDG
jgi:signal transduction histidine kinase